MKNMSKRILPLLLAGMLSVTALSGCSKGAPGDVVNDESKTETNSSPSEKGQTIQFWNAFTGTDGDVLREIVSKYNKENDKGITIEMDIMPGATLNEKLAPAITTGTAPSLLILGNADVAMYGQNGNMLPMDDFFDATGTDKNDFAEASLTGLQYEGKQLMIPMQWFSTYVYWNKDLFEAAGLDPEKGPSTWDEMEQMAAQVTNKDKNVYGMGLCASGGVSWYNALFMANGGDVIDLENKKSVLDSAENLDSLNYVKNIIDKGYSPKGNTGADLDNLMLADQLGIYINGPWLVNGLKENEINYGVTGMPAGKSKASGVAEISGYCIPKGTTDENKTAAYDFIAHWNTTEIGKEWSMRNGFPPFLKSVAEDSEVKANALVSTFAKMTDYAAPFAPGFTTAVPMNNDVLFPLIENVMAGNDPQEELTKASTELDELIATEK